MEVVSPGANGGAPLSNPFPSIDPNLVVHHLTDLLQITLGASKRDLEGPGSLLSKSRYADTLQRCARFASESQVALYVQKDVLTASEPNGVDKSLGASIPDSQIRHVLNSMCRLCSALRVYTLQRFLFLHLNCSIRGFAQTASGNRPVDTHQLAAPSYQSTRTSFTRCREWLPGRWSFPIRDTTFCRSSSTGALFRCLHQGPGNKRWK